MFENKEGLRINKLVKDLSSAWSRKDYKYCKKRIEDTLAKDPFWVPGHFAKFGFLFSVELDFKNAIEELKQTWELVQKESKDTVKDDKTYKQLSTIIPVTIQMIEKEYEKGTIQNTRLSLENVFPGNEFIILYGKSKGYNVSPLRKLIAQEKE